MFDWDTNEQEKVLTFKENVIYGIVVILIILGAFSIKMALTGEDHIEPSQSHCRVVTMQQECY